jgi:NAD(P)-dependent dehydrogenase (short-subunit alcohol dehydrogenase family)
MGYFSCVVIIFVTLVFPILFSLYFRDTESSWRFSSIPNQNGKVVLCTGGNAGIGFHFVRHMVKNGAVVIMACRSEKRCAEAAEKIVKEFPEAKLDTLILDLASQKSIKLSSEKVLAKYDRLDILCNNAGVAGLTYNLTEDGFEQHIGINHFGTFALTGRLFPLLSKTPNSRIVTVSSIMEKFVPFLVDLEDLHWKNKWPDHHSAYSVSKLANILFGKELQRRIDESNLPILSILSHPGYSYTELQSKMQTYDGEFLAFFTSIFGQTSEAGSAPLLYAATDSSISGGKYYGPDGIGELRGWPKEVPSWNGNDMDAAKKLWEVSEKETGVIFTMK